MTKNDIIKKYISLSKKAGKLLNHMETQKYVTSERSVRKEFGNLTNLQKEALQKDSKLELLIINREDVKNFNNNLEIKKLKTDRKVLLNNTLFLENLIKIAEKTFKTTINPYKIPKSKEKISRALNLTLSDLHFGADISSEETGFLTYSKNEEARRFAEIIKQTIEYKPNYRKQTELHVNLIGDLIQHKLHDPQDAAALSEQICRAIHLLSQGLAQLAENFVKVSIHCSTGNHGRDLGRHQKRATSGKWDSIETVICYALKKVLSKYNNMRFIIPKTPYVMYDVLGHKVFATHGDTTLKPGNPGKSINIASLETQINRINTSMNDKDEIKIAIVGHTHCASVSNLNTGAVLVTNGCLPPSDAFAVSLGFLENRASQTIFEMTKDHALGDLRFIRVGKEQDEDSKLDKIIEPFKGFND